MTSLKTSYGSLRIPWMQEVELNKSYHDYPPERCNITSPSNKIRIFNSQHKTIYLPVKPVLQNKNWLLFCIALLGPISPWYLIHKALREVRRRRNEWSRNILTNRIPCDKSMCLIRCYNANQRKRANQSKSGAMMGRLGRGVDKRKDGDNASK